MTLRPDPSFDRSSIACPKPSVDAPPDVEDGLFGCQWHLFNDGGRGGVAGEDINVGSAWNTTMGAGVNVVVVDRGVWWHHPDLIDNALPSRNHSYVGGDVSDDRYSHGTSVAGVIAARDNSIGVRGGGAPGEHLLLRPQTGYESGKRCRCRRAGSGLHLGLQQQLVSQSSSHCRPLVPLVGSGCRVGAAGGRRR